jgi:Zn-finger nucleic acid-binding protein
MNCPVCKQDRLDLTELELGLRPKRCGGCGGLWLSSQQFDNWINALRAGRADRSEPTDIATPNKTSTPARICPECAHLLTRYKVGDPLGFSLDRCGHCGGSWFDAGEWETLRSSVLWDQIHLIFSPAWQNRIRREEQVEQLRLQFAAKLGPNDFAEVERIKDWLTNHPHRDMILAHLADRQS